MAVASFSRTVLPATLNTLFRNGLKKHNEEFKCCPGVQILNMFKYNQIKITQLIYNKTLHWPFVLKIFKIQCVFGGSFSQIKWWKPSCESLRAALEMKFMCSCLHILRQWKHCKHHMCLSCKPRVYTETSRTCRLVSTMHRLPAFTFIYAVW